MVQQLVARQHLVGVAQQAFQQRELARAQVDAPIVDRHDARASSRLMGRHGATGRARGARSAAARQRAQARRQLLEGKRFTR